ncbi:hypothetical protein QY97_01806 [Bacillus thermotolerans]|uniref:Uncharacterized protein n=1 Tax=Bacillus thermotolerans TaxID=1221996 RepID=A0A0F5I8C2_BACTR|nr:hypothetical protein QY97_01806 [Bacillus thermotolerans]KKB41442.1 hypothetical protein QY95_00761 [Bacillus thermotolerans]KKB43993.1 hypothetical protein QY96_00185 [Bacillus thermotolerans]
MRRFPNLPLKLIEEYSKASPRMFEYAGALAFFVHNLSVFLIG